MKKLLKLTFKFTILILIIGILFIQYLKSDFNKSYDLILSQVKPQIKNADSVPKEFIKIYDKINSITDTNGILIDKIREKNDRDCPCLNLSYLLQKSYILSWKLEKDFTQSECLNMYLKRTGFLFNNRGIFDASKYYFKKPLNKLNFDEIVTLVLMTKNPKKYNPIIYPEKIKKAIEKIKTKHNKV